MPAIENRHEFVLFFDVTNGNPNGDPDAGNMPRIDPETGHGLVTDVCLKRKVRNFTEFARGGETGYAIYVQENAILNEQHRKAYIAMRPGDKKVNTDKKLNPRDDAEAAKLRDFMCANFFDVRTFGAVMSTGVNCGQVRGPVQIGFASSIEPVSPIEISITRMAATNENEKNTRADGTDDERIDNRTMGRKYIIPYGLYRVHGFISAKLAEKTGFSPEDLTFFWQALLNAFEHDHSAARGQVSVRKLIVFRHATALGAAPAQDLFDLVAVTRVVNGQPVALDSPLLADHPPARRFSHYAINLVESSIPKGVSVEILR